MPRDDSNCQRCPFASGPSLCVCTPHARKSSARVGFEWERGSKNGLASWTRRARVDQTSQAGILWWCLVSSGVSSSFAVLAHPRLPLYSTLVFFRTIRPRHFLAYHQPRPTTNVLFSLALPLHRLPSARLDTTKSIAWDAWCELRPRGRKGVPLGRGLACKFRITQ